jgi:hypothetical protein
LQGRRRGCAGHRLGAPAGRVAALIPARPGVSLIRSLGLIWSDLISSDLVCLLRNACLYAALNLPRLDGMCEGRCRTNGGTRAHAGGHGAGA